MCVLDGASQAVLSTLLCPPGLECLLDAGQLVTHMGNLRHDYSQFTLYIVLREMCHMLIPSCLLNVMLHSGFPHLLERSDFFHKISRTWKVLENEFGPGN